MSNISNHYDAMSVIVGTIQGLNLTGLTGGVVLQEVATYQDAQLPLPFISVSPYGPEQIGDELNDRDGCYYGILVAIIAKPNVNLLEQRLGWRQSIRRQLKNVSLSDLITKYNLPANTNLGQNYNLDVEPGPCVESKVWFARNGFVSGMVVRARFQEPRTP